ncbi:MAG: T9SS type A sorting domain-containing protein, partial [Bacteroidales bacterium]|nr:T9SS type A sorting domain-containing protein [Bacteroidales bacterium]
LATDVKLHQNYPNPFINKTKITYELSKQSFVKMSIYNINGQRVRVLIDKIKPKGTHTIIWNGKSETGQILESGIYFYELRTEKGTARKKMSLISVCP